ncbi:MAG: hypothetical protein MZW92_44270 [Comamonadaceae bacterium]|nr:hypothetical protein [Comamonadaceae bacterium]
MPVGRLLVPVRDVEQRAPRRSSGRWSCSPTGRPPRVEAAGDRHRRQRRRGWRATV